jgi:hypothetical protein
MTGKKISALCYEHAGGDYYTMLTPYGWTPVMFVHDGLGFTVSWYEH